MKKIKKENKMKNKTKARVLSGVLSVLQVLTPLAGAAVLLNACGEKPETPEPQPVEQSKTISGITTFDGIANVTINYVALPGATPGYLSLIEGACEDILQYAMKGGNLTINVIAGNSGFAKTGSKTLSVGESWFTSKSQLDVTNAMALLSDAWVAQLKKQNRIRYAGGMSPYELAQFNKKGYVRA